MLIFLRNINILQFQNYFVSGMVVTALLLSTANATRFHLNPKQKKKQKTREMDLEIRGVGNEQPPCYS